MRAVMKNNWPRGGDCQPLEFVQRTGFLVRLKEKKIHALTRGLQNKAVADLGRLGMGAPPPPSDQFFFQFFYAVFGQNLIKSYPPPPPPRGLALPYCENPGTKKTSSSEEADPVFLLKYSGMGSLRAATDHRLNDPNRLELLAYIIAHCVINPLAIK